MVEYEIKQIVTEYLQHDETLKDYVPDTLTVLFVLERFREHRNYPSKYTEDMIEADMRRYRGHIAMAMVDAISRYGAEGEISHSENNIERNWKTPYLSTDLFENIPSFVRTI